MAYVFGGAAFLIGFALTARAVLPRLVDAGDVFIPLLIVFLLYSAAAASFLVLSAVLQDMGLAVYCLVALGALAEIPQLVREFKGRSDISRGDWLFVLFLYIAGLLVYTLFSRSQSSSYVLETDLMKPFEKVIRRRSYAALYHSILNVCLFFPVGFLYGGIRNHAKAPWLPALGLGCFLTTFIETGQLLFRLGNCDVTDMLANALGTVCGLAVYMYFYRDDPRTRRMTDDSR